MRSTNWGGTRTRSSLIMNSALRKLDERPDATDHRHLDVFDALAESSSNSRSKTGWVTTNSAPACTFHSRQMQLVQR